MNNFIQGLNKVISTTAILVLAGWIFDIIVLKKIRSDWVSMSPTTAVCFFLLSFVWPKISNRRLAEVIPVIVGAISILVFGEYILHYLFKFPEVLGKESPFYFLKMAPHTAFCFLLFSFTLLRKGSFEDVLNQTMTVLIGSVSLVALIGYLYDVQQLYKVSAYATMAIHTAGLFFLLCLRSLAQQKNYGIGRILCANSLVRPIGLRLLTITILFPILLGWLMIKGQHLGVFGLELGTALLVVAASLTLGGFVFYSMKLISGALDGQKIAEQKLLAANISLEKAALANERDLQKTLKENLAYKAALDQTAIVAFTDKKGAITDANELFCKISGYNLDELIGQNHRILNSRYHSKEFFVDLWKTISSGEIWRGEICNESKSGQNYWVDTAIVPLVSEQKKIEGYFAVRFDITNRKMMEHQLVHSAKMAALGEMASGIAHEINNPLTTICVRSVQLQRAVQSGDLNELTESSKVIEKTVFRISSIIKALRAFARDGDADPVEIVSLKTIIDDTVLLCAARFRKSEITLYCDVLPIRVRCKPSQVSQALLNLLNNAYDAISPLEAKWIRIETAENGPFCEISVTDSGLGIPAQIQEKIMQPFFTTKEVGMGMGLGLGLSLSKGLLEDQNGFLKLDTKFPNTRFVIGLEADK